MSEQSNKENLYHIPTPGEYLQAARTALNGATEERWRECVDLAQRNLAALDHWMGGNLLCDEDLNDSEEQGG